MSATQHLLFLVSHNGLLLELGDGQTVDLRSAGVERLLVFRNDRSFRLELDDRVIEWGATRISGLTLKTLAGVDRPTFALWLVTRGV